MRKIASVVLVVGLLASLAACSSDAKSPTSGCTPSKSGSVSDAVTVSGKYGATPTVKLKTPITKTKSTERTVITQGKGKIATAGTVVKTDFVLYNGTTGKELTNTGFDGKTVPFTMDATKYLPGLVKTLKCSAVGSRVVGAIPPSDAFSSTGSTNLGVGAKDEIVFVADVVSVSPAPPAALKGAKGATQAPKDGFPTVVVSAKGIPTVTIPDTAQPAKFMEETLIKGTGAKVGSNANVVVNYQLILWRTKAIVSGNDTYTSGTPASFNTGEVVAGFKQALEGQTVGSRVLFVVPPALGYGTSGQSTAGITGTDDLVFIVDILGLG
ncbi:MAG TPA: FKBP-type peptidyl-prolyl cis-trans isomerase [Galbitalea sp.]